MAEAVGALYPTQIPSLSEVADIQEALRLYHYGRPSGTSPGQYDPTNTNPTLLNPSGTTPSVAWYLYDLQNQITTVSGSLGVQASTWTAKGALVTAISAGNLIALTVGTNGQVLTANTATASGLQWSSPEVTLSNTATLTNKNISLTTNAITGTLAEFNAALSDADFATIAGSETLTNKTLTAPRFADLGFIADTNGNELIIMDTVASAVNEITVANAATGSAPTITASGETNVSLNLVPKGTGTVQVSGVPIVTTTATQTLTNKTLTAPRITSASNIADSNGNELILFPATVASAVNEITISNATVSNPPSISASGNDTNISLNLIPKGTGTVQANGVPVVTTTGSQTLTNKTLTLPTISGTGVNFSGSSSGTTNLLASATAPGTITLPAVTGTVITTGDTSTVTNAMLAGSIADSKLSTISTAGKVSNSATTAASANTANAIVARDASGNFNAGTITATGIVGQVTVNSGSTANVGKIFVHNPSGGNPTGAVAGDIWIW